MPTPFYWRCCAIEFAFVAGAAFLVCVAVAPARAEEPHIHGQTVPSWYDPNCCSNHDCKPVDDTSLEFDTAPGGHPFARYKPTGNVFFQHQWKTSQDERYHFCINPYNAKSLCFYVRAGA